MTLKKTIGGLAVAAAILGFSAIPALANAIKTSPLYGPIDPFVSCSKGGAPTEQTFGSVQMHINNRDQVTSIVSIHGGIPNTDYSIYVNQDPGGCPTTPTATIHTNSAGNGSKIVNKAKVKGATNFWVSAVGGKQVLRSKAVTLPTPSPSPTSVL